MLNVKNGIVLTGCLAAMLGTFACNKTTQEASKTTTENGTSTAPSGSEAKRADTALVRFVNATLDPKDIFFGDTKPVSNLAAGSVTPYMQLPTERHEFKLFDAGRSTGDPLSTDSEGPSAGSHYTVVAMMKEDGKPALNVISDDLDRPTPGKAKIRVIHTAPGVGDVDVYPINGKDALISGVGFAKAASYKEVDPGITELDVRRHGSKRDELKVKDVHLDPDKLYTVILMGGKGQPLTANVIEDQLVNSVG